MYQLERVKSSSQRELGVHLLQLSSSSFETMRPVSEGVRVLVPVTVLVGGNVLLAPLKVLTLLVLARALRGCVPGCMYAGGTRDFGYRFLLSRSSRTNNF